MKLFEIQRNVESGQCKNALMRVQIGYTAIFLGVGLIKKGWSGLQFGFLAPAHNPLLGYKRIKFYARLLPGLSGCVGDWPSWYSKLKKIFSYEFTLKKGWK